MITIKNILCPVDFSEHSSRACDYAFSLARHYRAKVFLQHVVEPLAISYPSFTYPESLDRVYSEMTVEARRHLAELISDNGLPGVESEMLVETGPVAYRVLKNAEEKNIDLIVMGTHGRQGLMHLAMGSVTEKVLRNARCPLLAVRQPSHDFIRREIDKDSVNIRRILFSNDFSECAEHSLSYALHLAMEYNAQLTLLHVLENLPPSGDQEQAMAAAVATLEKPIAPIRSKLAGTTAIVRIGKPYEQIVQAALESQADLIVIGVRGRNALDLALFGSTTHRVLQRGNCPVLVVPSAHRK